MNRPRSALHPYQQRAVERLVAGKQVACFLEPGLGKTSITLTTLVDLDRPRTLVLAPARVADTVWKPEAAAWEHTRCLWVEHATGGPAQRTAAVESRAADVVTLSYENLPWLLENFDLEKYFDCVVFDELSKMKTAGSSRFRKLRTVIRKIPYRFGLTGTPVGNHLIDIWGEMYCVADERPLGPSVVEFQYRYFRPKARKGHIVYSWDILPGAEAEIHRRIKPWAFTLDASEAPKLAEIRVHEIDVRLPDEVAVKAQELAIDLSTQLDSGTALHAFSGTVANMKVRQMVGGAVYVTPPTVLGEPLPQTKTWEPVHDAKMDALADLVDELQGEPLLLFYWFQHEKERILKRFKQAASIDEKDAIARWNRREIEVLIAHPASAGHGLNLQHGGHNICWYTLPYSLEMWMQAHGRLRRHGQKSPFVNSHILLAGKADRVVLSALHRKDLIQDALLEAMLD